MQPKQGLSFGPYRLDPVRGQLWRGTQIVKLPPKALAVLGQLLAHPSQVVTKEELFGRAWADTVVSDAALTYCIQELRRVLRDDARKPRYIETVHRRGYRFIGKVVSNQYPVVSSPPLPTQHPGLSTQHPVVVGRDTELQQLQRWLDKALNGERQIVFVTGEPGIGKTSVLDAFVAQVAAEGTAWLGQGQCIEHYGTGEPYLPLLEALGRLCRERGGKHLLALFKQQAPTWVVQMPALLSTADFEGLQRKVAGATKERMLRELAEAMEALTAERPLVLVLEDLHWSDVSTLDWLAFVARRRERARLLVIGTYRPVEVLTREHPLKEVKQELQIHRQCEEVALDFLDEENVAEYLAMRFSGGVQHAASFRSLARVIHQRTDGNPLFMVNLVAHLLSQGVLVQVEGQWRLKEEKTVVTVPETLQQMIEQRLAQVGRAERTVLEVASVAGTAFSAAAVAAGGENTIETVEAQCTELARRELFLGVEGTTEWPDGTVATQYSFQHALYQEVLSERIPASRRVTLHRQIGEREEQAYGPRAREIAAKLALHFEQGRECRKAVQYLQHAGENALRHSAHREAVSHLTKGLELLTTLPDTPERTQQELLLQTSMGLALIATKGYATPEVEKTYLRAQELCQQVQDTPQLFRVLWGLWLVYAVRPELQVARELAEQLLRLAQSAQNPLFLLPAHYALGWTLLWRGEGTVGLAHLEQGIALYDPQKHRSLASVYGQHPAVTSLGNRARALGLLGYPDQALKGSQEAIALAQDVAHPYSLSFALCSAAELHLFRREYKAAQGQAEALITLSEEQGFSYWLASGIMCRGAALSAQGQEEEGITQICQGLAANRAAGASIGVPDTLALLAEAYGKVGQLEEGLTALTEALDFVNRTEQRYYEADLYRLKGELLLAQEGYRLQAVGHRAKTEEAEACFHKAIEIARKQLAKSLELRATMSLARLWQKQDKKEEARQMLADIYGWFTEGFDTADLQEAQALLEELS